MTLKIDGQDMTPYIAYGGVKWQRSDVDGEESGRMLDGTLDRDRIATKIRLDITCRALRSCESSVVLTAILPEWVSVEYDDPQLGQVVTRTMYSNNTPATFLMVAGDGTQWWEGITFPLIER